MTDAIEVWGGSLPVGQRAPALEPIRHAIARLADEATALFEAGDYESLAAGGQDIEVVIDELSTVYRDVRLFVASIVDHREREARVRDAAERASDGRRPIKRNDPDASLGLVRTEVAGVGAVEINGGYYRTNWQSDKLLRRMLHIALDGMSIFDATTGEDARDAAIERVAGVLTDVMPIRPSMQWRVGSWPRGDQPATGLKLYGINDADWCDRTDKVRLASWPRRSDR